jgi:hypothetical protein
MSPLQTCTFESPSALPSFIDLGVNAPAVCIAEPLNTTAPLSPLVSADMYFESPSAFSIYLKRLVNPTRKADDGWKTVKYAGK